jgi:biopolymer transport protein ExbB/TolQ
MFNPFTRPPTAPAARSRFGWLTGWLGHRGIEQRVIENLPSWNEFADRKLREAKERQDEDRFELPPHQVDVGSPLQWNVLYLLLAGGAIGLAYATPTWASWLIYAAIFSVFGVALLVTLRDAVFFHMESHRLDLDGEMINARTDASQKEGDSAKGKGGLLGRKARNTVFRSNLMQIHYQNILRTFESGSRRAWVNQDSSISDIQTLVSQRGMKLAWTLIEVLPQLGLLGTLIGLTQMFQAFHVDTKAPEIAILSGFGTALGATLLANLFVLVLRPLHMRNERAMNEILSTLQVLMAMFILPTQQQVLERQAAAQTPQGPLASAYTSAAPVSDRRLSESLEDLSRQIAEFNQLHKSLDTGNAVQNATEIARDLRQAVKSIRDAFDPKALEGQQRALSHLGEAMHELSGRLTTVTETSKHGQAPAPVQPSERMEHDLLQLRVLTRDTLVLLERISGQLEHLGAGPADLLSREPRVRSMAFPAPESELDSPPPGNGTPRRGAEPERPPVGGVDPVRRVPPREQP